MEESFEKHREKNILATRVRNKKYWNLFKVWKKKQECRLCGEDEQICLDFHHIDPSKKEFGIAGKIYKLGLKKIRKELSKCTCICANCHRKVHKYGLKKTYGGVRESR